MPKYQTQITSQQRRWSYTNTQFIKKKKRGKLTKKDGANSSSKTADLNIIILIIISH